MKLIRTNPSSRLALAPFEDFFRDSFGALSAFDRLLGRRDLPGFDSPPSLPVDVYEDDGNYYARFEVPGVKREDVKIELVDHRLSVGVTRKSGAPGHESVSRLSRSLTVPDSIHADGISARLEDGLLLVTLPKQEQRKPRVIELN